MSSCLSNRLSNRLSNGLSNRVSNRLSNRLSTRVLLGPSAHNCSWYKSRERPFELWRSCGRLLRHSVRSIAACRLLATKLCRALLPEYSSTARPRDLDSLRPFASSVLVEFNSLAFEERVSIWGALRCGWVQGGCCQKKCRTGPCAHGGRASWRARTDLR